MRGRRARLDATMTEAGVSEETRKLLHKEIGGPLKRWWHTRTAVRANMAYWRERYYAAQKRIDLALCELGVPQPGYPAPVANAANILRYGHPYPNDAGAELSETPQHKDGA